MPSLATALGTMYQPMPVWHVHRAEPVAGSKAMAFCGMATKTSVLPPGSATSRGVFHASLTPESRGLLGARELSLMKPSAYLVNTARAAIVDEGALVKALRAGKIAGAGLDVYLVEPLPPDSPWLTLDNVLLTPHVGGATSDVVRRHSEMILRDLRRWRRGEQPIHLRTG